LSNTGTAKQGNDEPRILAIGDIHGCLKALDALLESLNPQPHDFVITLGDYIDRGADSPGVIERLLDLESKCHLEPLLGNHELMLLTALEEPSQIDAWLRCGGHETLMKYGGSFQKIPERHIDFLKRCRHYVETPKHLFFHANYVADAPLEQQPAYSLYWEDLHIHLPRRHVSGKTAIVGHTPQQEGNVLDLGHIICIDTNCYGGGYLTGMDVLAGKYWQADPEGRLRK